MRIGVDLRSLSSGSISGVENYTMNVVEALLNLDKKNHYALFYNAWEGGLPGDFQYINSNLVHTRRPNKLLNLQFKFGISKVEQFVGNIDWFFMPNLNQFSISPQTKLALTVHDLSPVTAPEFYDAKRRLWHWFLNYKSAFARANLLFAVSEYTKQDLVRLFNVPENKIRVVYPGVDISLLVQNTDNSSLRAARNHLNLPGDFLLFLNTIEPRKNLENLIRAFEQLDGPAHLVIAGKSGWRNSKIFRQIRQSSKSRRIHYLGYVNESQKGAIIKMARALVYPSFYEGFGFQPLESFALGTPAVVSQVASLPEVVGNAALLVNPYNISDMTFALNEALTNQPLRRQLISKGFERVKKFNWQNAAGQIKAALENY